MRVKAGASERSEAESRVVPHSLEAERAVLGAILVSNGVLESTAKVLSGAEFFRAAHQQIYRAMSELAERGQAIDIVTLREVLGRQGHLERVGGASYIASLADGVPKSTNVKHYARIVWEMSRRRELLKLAGAVETAVYEGERSSTEILREHDGQCLAMQYGQTSQLVPVQQTAGDLISYLEDRHAKRGQVTGCDTGWQRLNDLTFGWQASDYIAIGARPSIGKTAFAVNAVVAASRVGKRAVVFSMEMKRRQLELRILSILSGVPLTAMAGGFVSSPAQWGLIAAAVDTLSASGLVVDDASALTVADIRRECRILASEGPIGLVVVDYIQLMDGTGARKGANRNEELTYISRRLKVLAGELGVPVLVLSQLKRTEGVPRLSDFRESGSIEQDCDVAILLHRKNHKESGPTSIILDKQRNGETGVVTLHFARETQRFTDMEHEPAEEADEATPVVSAAERHAARTRAIIRARAKRA